MVDKPTRAHLCKTRKINFFGLAVSLTLLRCTMRRPVVGGYAPNVQGHWLPEGQPLHGFAATPQPPKVSGFAFGRVLLKAYPRPAHNGLSGHAFGFGGVIPPQVCAPLLYRLKTAIGGGGMSTPCAGKVCTFPAWG